MNPRTSPGNSGRGVEALESRSLLSAAASPDVQVVEVAVAAQDDSVHILPLQLPASVVAALDARFPGATLVAAEASSADGGGLEFGVTAEFNGKGVDVTFTSAGTITETELAVSARELPRAVHDWVRRNFAGSVIGAAARVVSSDALAYQVLIDVPGQEKVEAKLRVPAAEAPNISPDTGVESPVTPGEPSETASFAKRSRKNRPAATSVQDASGELESPVDFAAADMYAYDASAPNAAPALAHARTEELPTPSRNDWYAPTWASARVTPPPANGAATSASTPEVPTAWAHAAAAVQAILAVAGDPAPPPALAGLLWQAFPADLGAIERQLLDVLGGINALTGQAGGDGAANAVGWSVAAAAGAIALVLVVKPRQPRGETAPVFCAASSSWSWVLGSATTPRRRA